MEKHTDSDTGNDVPRTPEGIVAMFINGDGRVVATANDFNPGYPGGFSQQDAQKIRARRALAGELMRALSSPLLAAAMAGAESEPDREWYEAQINALTTEMEQK